MVNTKNNSDINSSIDLIELDKFKAMAEEWWDPEGKFKPLHKFNPVRLEYIRNNCCDYFNLDKTSLTPLTGLSVLDIGCGVAHLNTYLKNQKLVLVKWLELLLHRVSVTQLPK